MYGRRCNEPCYLLLTFFKDDIINLCEIIKEHMKYRAQIIKPTIYMAVYYFAFTVGLRSSSPVGEYSYFFWLLSGMVPWFFMRDTFTSGAGSIRKYRYLVTRVKLPVCTMIVLFLAEGH